MLLAGFNRILVVFICVCWVHSYTLLCDGFIFIHFIYSYCRPVVKKNVEKNPMQQSDLNDSQRFFKHKTAKIIRVSVEKKPSVGLLGFGSSLFVLPLPTSFNYTFYNTHFPLHHTKHRHMVGGSHPLWEEPGVYWWWLCSLCISFLSPVILFPHVCASVP